jgi:hypothetical protein
MSKETNTVENIQENASTQTDANVNTNDANTQISDAPASIDESRKFVVGDLRSETIATCVEVIPSKGSNAGKLMYVINGKHWSRHKPADTDNTVVLEFSTWDGGSGWNVLGFNLDARTMTIDQKIAKVTSFDASYSNAIALLLK